MGHKNAKPKKLFEFDKRERQNIEENNNKMREDNITKSSFEYI